MYLLDTNVVSELRRVRLGRAHANVAQWADHVDVPALFISVITLQELEIGVRLIERRGEKQGAVLRAWLDRQVRSAFDGRILPVDKSVALASARLHVPDPKPFRDGLIAATALVHRMTLVTRNVGDFSGSGVSLLNPWEL